MGKQQAVVACMGGSLGHPSRSLAVLRIAAAGAEDAGAEVEVLDLRELDLPLYRPGVEVPESADRLCDAFYRASGLIWSRPMYHGTISGSFKSAIDRLQTMARRDPPYLTDKVIGLISIAGGVQALQAVNTMEFAVRSLRGFAAPLVIPVSTRQAFDAEGRLTDERVEQRLRSLGNEVARLCLGHRPLHDQA